MDRPRHPLRALPPPRREQTIFTLLLPLDVFGLGVVGIVAGRCDTQSRYTAFNDKMPRTDRRGCRSTYEGNIKWKNENNEDREEPGDEHSGSRDRMLSAVIAATIEEEKRD